VWRKSRKERRMTYFAKGETSRKTWLEGCQRSEAIVRRRRADQAHVMIELVTRSDNELRSRYRIIRVRWCRVGRGDTGRSGEDFGSLLETVLLPSRIAS